jgi:hypothetical protein
VGSGHIGSSLRGKVIELCRLHARKYTQNYLLSNQNGINFRWERRVLLVEALEAQGDFVEEHLGK